MNLITLFTLPAFLSFALVNSIVIDPGNGYDDDPLLKKPVDDYVINATHTRLGRLGETVVCLVRRSDFIPNNEGKSTIKENFNGSLCTHAIFTYSDLCNTTTCDVFETDNSNITDGQFAIISDLKTAWPNLRVGVSIGGYAEGSVRFGNVTKDLWSRYRFVKNVVSKLKNAGATSLELSWYAPTIRYAGKPEDRRNYVELIKEFKKSSSKLGWHFGVAIKIFFGSIDYYDIRSISPLVDWIRVETHGFHSHWEPTAGFNAPLYGRKGDRKTVAYWIHQVAALSDPKRLLLEIPFFGRSWLLASEPVPGGPGSESIGLFTDKATVPYFQICETLHSNNTGFLSWEEKWDPYSMTPWAIKGNKYFSYDNEKSIKAKVDFARRLNLAGVSAYFVGMDDLEGKCGRGKMPLLNAVHASVSASLKT